MNGEKYGEPCKHGAMLRHLCSDCLTERLDEWKAKAHHWETVAGGISRDTKSIIAERDAALAKAEAAEKAAAELRIMAADNRNWREAHADLRARIETLAATYDLDGYTLAHGVAGALRALLHPRKVETALDVLSRIEKWGDTDEPMDAIIEDLAKLRKMLEREEGK